MCRYVCSITIHPYILTVEMFRVPVWRMCLTNSCEVLIVGKYFIVFQENCVAISQEKLL